MEVRIVRVRSASGRGTSWARAHIRPSRLREGSGEGLLDKGYKRPTMRSRELRLNATEAERKLWAQLSARKVSGIRFNRQFPIGPFICDFVSRPAKLVIEEIRRASCRERVCKYV